MIAAKKIVSAPIVHVTLLPIKLCLRIAPRFLGAAMLLAIAKPAPVSAQMMPDPPPPIVFQSPRLTAVERSVPDAALLANFIQDKTAALKLGKALFWDMQIGSDGFTSCATCHFHAGADSRSKNQRAPGLLTTPRDMNSTSR
jgi:cytochrome c peroxidase